MKQTICDSLQIIGKRINAAEINYQRETGSVALLAVSKSHPVTTIGQYCQCSTHSIPAFGESYAQEMQKKASQLQHHGIQWHFIGPIQSNKTRIIAETAHWVHAIDRYKVAKRISAQKPAEKPPINLCLQVNISHEPGKSGVALHQLPELAERTASLSGIVLRGLMAIPAPGTTFDQQRDAFAKVRKAMEGLNAQGYNLDTLSMGMSGDMEAAIAEGATIVRIGTALFGQRP